MKNTYKSKGIVSAIVILSVMVIGVIATYPYILRNYRNIINETKAVEEKMNQERKNYLKEEFMDMLFQSNYSLYTDIVQQNNNRSMTPSEIFLPNYGGNAETYENAQSFDKQVNVQIENETESESYQIILDLDEIEGNKRHFNGILNSWSREFYNTNIDRFEIEYYIQDNVTKNYITNTIKSLDDLLSNDEAANNLQSSYSFYAAFQYDSKGELHIPIFGGLEQDKKEWYITRELTKEVIKQSAYDNNWYQYGNQIKGPKDVTIFYAIKGEDFYYGNNYYMSYSGEREAFERGGFIQIFGIMLFLLVFVSIFLSVKKSWGVREIAGKIPGEISVFGIFVPLIFYSSLLSMAEETSKGSFLDLSDLLLSNTAERILNYMFNYVVWMLILGIALFCLISIWQVFSLGIRRYLLERTICGKCLVKLNKFLKSLKEIDLTDNSNKAIIKILVVNFVILTILCSIWVAGIVGLILYSIIVFFIINKYVIRLKQQYQVLMNATSKMAEGNLEVVVEEDLGVLNPLKEELNKVQFGFKTAVEEEMKSQKMKTELISNVSHDLKTPLTAIITYVNLLKDENITEEERRSYIETLDKKSMRLKRLIEDLFEMSKANSDNIQLNLVEVDIVSLIKQVQLELGDKISQSEIEFRNRFPEEKVILKLDSDKTYRIFENLIINITKYALNNTRAYIELMEDDTTVFISLKNVSATEIDFIPAEITERFVRGDKSRNTEGSGLGLAIVKSFVELQGGKMEIQLDGDLFKVNIKFKKV